MPKYFINASNIKLGGGLVLLNDILECYCGPQKIHLVISDLLKGKILKNKYITPIFISASLYNRLLFDFKLHKQLGPKDRILVFGNLPPLLRFNCMVIVFMQNRLILEKLSSFNLSICIQKIWFRVFHFNSDVYYVQSEIMKLLLESFIQRTGKFVTFPFYNSRNKIESKKDSLIDFIYPASDLKHKNHTRLIESWIILSKMKIYPSLILTFNEKSNIRLSNFLNESIITHNLKIYNYGEITHSQIISFYKTTRALIFPSLTESFGLPLLEGVNYKLDIIASDSDFVHDIISPTLTFNPRSSRSIAKNVSMYLQLVEVGQNKKSSIKRKFHSPDSFIKHALNLPL